MRYQALPPRKEKRIKREEATPTVNTLARAELEQIGYRRRDPTPP